MSAPQLSDAQVFFGATGDLAYKQIFPALQALVRRGALNAPIVGVAKSGWNLDQLRARAKDSLEHHGGVDRDAFDKLCSLLRYVDGDYADATTFQRLRHELGATARPLHYLAIPPSAFTEVIHGLAQVGCTTNARVAAEKPFGRDEPLRAPGRDRTAMAHRRSGAPSRAAPAFVRAGQLGTAGGGSAGRRDPGWLAEPRRSEHGDHAKEQVVKQSELDDSARAVLSSARGREGGRRSARSHPRRGRLRRRDAMRPRRSTSLEGRHARRTERALLDRRARAHGW